ncbi:MAG: ribosomal-protein-alanine N-acetyltransferase [Rickettsiales bacterium]|jgi:ribosomal-protein-alanine N-acetyltransferase
MLENSKAPVRNFPIIDLGDYILREQTLEDAESFLEYYGDPVVNEHIVSSIPRNVEEARTEINYWINVYNYNDGIYFAIARKSDDKMIGSVGVSGINRMHNRIEASYDLAKEYWNKGIMSKALRAVVKYAFLEKKFNRIEAYAIPNNVGSYRVLEKCGFKFEGNLRGHRYHNGKYVDIGIYSILRGEVIT